MMIDGGQVQEPGFRERITRDLTAIIRTLAMMAMVHYLWLSYGSFLCARHISAGKDGEPAEDQSTL